MPIILVVEVLSVFLLFVLCDVVDTENPTPLRQKTMDAYYALRRGLLLRTLIVTSPPWGTSQNTWDKKLTKQEREVPNSACLLICLCMRCVPCLTTVVNGCLGIRQKTKGGGIMLGKANPRDSASAGESIVLLQVRTSGERL